MKPRDRVSRSRFPAEIDAAAVRWLGLRDAGQMTPEDEGAFAAWLEADERHAAAFAEIDQVWDDFDSLKSLRPAAGEPDADLLVPPTARAARSRRVWRGVVPALLATAAALAFAWLGWWRPAESAGNQQSLVTRVGGHQIARLPDGSTVELNTDTAVEVQFSAGERRVHLRRGEAHFTVAKDRARPFKVFVGDVAVQAVGTAFNVRLDSASVEVLVTEGKVQVGASARVAEAAGKTEAAADRAPAESPLVIAGQRVRIPVEVASVAPAVPAATAVTSAEIVRALAWQQQRLEFEDAPLAHIVAEFNRYNDHKLAVEDAQLARQRFGGKFHPHGYEGLVRMLEASFGVEVERRETETRLRLPAEASVGR